MPKSEGQLTSECLERIGVTADQIAEAPKISSVLRRSIGGRAKVLELLQGSSEPDARKILKVVEEVGRRGRTGLPLEAYAIAAGLTTRRMFELVAGEAFVRSGEEAALVAATAHPKVVRKSVEMALTGKGVNDRKMLHQHAGFLPMPKTQFVTMNGGQQINASSQTQVNVAVLPSVEDSVKRLSDRFNEQPSAPLMIAERVIEQEDEEDEEE